MRVLICGGGISGLTTALACVDAGFDVSVFERASELSEVGAGIQIGPNAARVLARVGVGDALAAAAAVPAFQEMRLGELNLNIFRTVLGAQAAKKYGAPYYLLHRADLIEMLGAALESRQPGALELGRDVAAYEHNGKQASVVFSDGQRESGQVVIGADGIHSTFRSQMLGDEQPRFTGNVVWRVMLPASERLKRLIPNSMCIWVGPEKHCVTYWLRGGQVLNFVGAVERDNWTGESWNEPGPKADFEADFGGWCKPISEVVDAARECSRWALFDRDPMAQWVDGSVALVGDACHPMLPFLAQGAAMGIEDAWVLAAALKRSGSNVHRALKQYAQTRQPRTAKVQNAARARMHSNHERTMVGQLRTYAPMWLSSRLNPAKFDRRFQWLYGEDVTAPGSETTA